MKLIPLTNYPGLMAQVDDDIYDKIHHLEFRGKKEHKGRISAVLRYEDSIKYGFTYLHRFAVGVTDQYTKIKFRDGNCLNCQRANLEILPRKSKAIKNNEKLDESLEAGTIVSEDIKREKLLRKRKQELMRRLFDPYYPD